MLKSINKPIFCNCLNWFEYLLYTLHLSLVITSFGFAMVGHLKYECSALALKFNSNTKVQFTTSAQLLQNHC